MEESLLHRISEGVHDMCYIWSREIKATVKDEGVLIFFILVPLLYPLLYAWIYNAEVVRDVPVTVVDMSHSAQSREFIRLYDASPDVHVKYHSNNLEEAKGLIGKQAVHGVIYIPANFATRLMSGEQAHVSVYCDMSIMLYYKAVYQSASNVSSKMSARLQVAKSGNFTDRDDEITVKPLDYEEVPIFNPAGGYADFILPGVLILILHQTLLLGIGLSAGTARENNRYRDLVPVSRHYNGIFRIVLGKSMSYFMIYAVMTAYVTICVPRLFDIIQLAHFGDLAVFLLPFLLSAVFFGMTLSCVIRYRENIMLLVVFTSVPLLFLSGVLWPQSNMPGFWRVLACFFPSTFGIRGFVRLNTMGATLADIRQEYMALWAQTLVYFFTTCAVYRYQIIRARRHAIASLRRMKDNVTLAKVHRMVVEDGKE